MNDWGKINTFNMSLPQTNVKIKVFGQSLGYLGLEKKEVLSPIVSTYFCVCVFVIRTSFALG